MGVEFDKQNAIQLLFDYLRQTKPLMLFLHLLWVLILCFGLSVTYLITFHFSNLVSVYQDAHNINNFSSNLINNGKYDEQVNKVLTDLLESTHSSRTYVFRYHNGLAAVNGVPFFFQTNTHEVISPGTSRVMQFEQHLPISINIAVNNQFLQNKCSIIPAADADKDSQHYWFFQQRNAKSLVRCPIYMSNGDLFGFVGIDLTDRTEASKLESIAQRVKLTASTLADIFANKR